MRGLHEHSCRVATATVAIVALVFGSTGCASAGAVLFPATSPSKPEVRTRLVDVATTDGHRFGSAPSPSLEQLGLQAPVLVGTVVPGRPGNPFAAAQNDDQDAATFDIVVNGDRSFFSDPVQMGGVALVLALLASFVSGSTCTEMAASLGHCQ